MAIIEDDAGAGRLCGDEIDRGTEGLEVEVRHHSQPREEGRGLRIEAGGVKLLGKRVSFEVYRDVGEVCRSGKAAGFEEIALPLLCRGVVDLEDAKVWVRVAVSEGVEAGTEKDILRGALFDGESESVFGVAAAGDEEGAKADGERTVRTGGRAAKLFCIGVSENRNSDGIVENEWRRIVELVGRATQSYAECCSRGSRGLHRFYKCRGIASEHPQS